MTKVEEFQRVLGRFGAAVPTKYPNKDATISQGPVCKTGPRIEQSRFQKMEPRAARIDPFGLKGTFQADGQLNKPGEATLA